MLEDTSIANAVWTCRRPRCCEDVLTVDNRVPLGLQVHRTRVCATVTTLVEFEQPIAARRVWHLPVNSKHRRRATLKLRISNEHML